jgi:hypothetical protein
MVKAEQKAQPEKSKPRQESRKAEPKEEQPKRRENVEADAEWNGPLPSFLSVSAS